MSLSTLCQEFLSLSKVLGHPWPTEVGGTQNGLRGTATPDFISMHVNDHMNPLYWHQNLVLTQLFVFNIAGSALLLMLGLTALLLIRAR